MDIIPLFLLGAEFLMIILMLKHFRTLESHTQKPDMHILTLEKHLDRIDAHIREHDPP